LYISDNDNTDNFKIGRFRCNIQLLARHAICMPSLCYEHDVRPSVRPSTCNVGRLWSHSATISGNLHTTG